MVANAFVLKRMPSVSVRFRHPSVSGTRASCPRGRCFLSARYPCTPLKLNLIRMRECMLLPGWGGNNLNGCKHFRTETNAGCIRRKAGKDFEGAKETFADDSDEEVRTDALFYQLTPDPADRRHTRARVASLGSGSHPHAR